MNNSSILDQNSVDTTFESPAYMDFDDSSPHTRTLCTTNTLTLKHNAALFLIRMKQEGKVSQKIMDRLVSDVTLFMQQCVDEIQQTLVTIEPSIHVMYPELKSKLQQFLTLFNGLHSNHLLNKYMTEHLYFVVSKINMLIRFLFS